MDPFEARKLISKSKYRTLAKDVSDITGFGYLTVRRQLAKNSKVNTPNTITILNTAFECIKKHNNKIITK